MLPGGSIVKNLPTNVGAVGLIPTSGRSPGEGPPIQCFCLGNPMNRGAWWAKTHGGRKTVRYNLEMKQQHIY